MTALAYNSGLLTLCNGGTAFASDDCYMILVGSGYTFSAAHSTYANVSGEEIDDADYDPVALGSKSVTVESGNILYDCANVTFGDPVTIDAAGGMAIILKGTAASPQSTDPLLFAWELTGAGASTNSEFTVTTPNGLYEIEINTGA